MPDAHGLVDLVALLEDRGIHRYCYYGVAQGSHI
jgi:hypothetical protein